MTQTKQTSHMAVRALCEGALMVVLAQVLGHIKLWEMPWGGSICLSMLPIFFYACRWGLGRGLLAGIAVVIVAILMDRLTQGWFSKKKEQEAKEHGKRAKGGRR